MKVFKCVISGDELFTDSDKFKIEGGFYKVKGKFVTRVEGDVQLDGANPSAEEGEEASETCAESGVDIVMNARMLETGFGTKKDYQLYMKGYMKNIMTALESRGASADEIACEKAEATNAFKDAMAKFKDLQFFSGSSLNTDGIIALNEWVDEEEDGKAVSTPYFYFYKAGVREEKF